MFTEVSVAKDLIRLLVIIAVAACWPIGAALSQTPGSVTVKVALVIGNSAYQQAVIPAAVSDAGSIAEVLRLDGFDVVYIENAKRSDMEAAIDLFRKKLTANCIAIVFYSGHSVQYQNRNFLVPLSAIIERESDVRRETIDVDLILDPMIVSAPLGGAIILDASRPNPWQQIAAPKARGLAAQQSVRGIGFVYSAAPGKLESSVRSAHLFVSELVKQLAVPDIGIDTALRRVEQAVSRASHGEEIPWHSAIEKDFAISSAVLPSGARPRAGKSADEMEAGFWTTIQDSKNAADYQAYLDSYPNGQFALLAREHLSQLGSPRGPGAAIKGSITPTRDCSECPELVLVPAGAFMMGSTELFQFEGPIHQVRIAKPFFIGRNEVTFDEWDACVADGGCQYRPNDRGWGRGLRPVSDIDWNDANVYISWLSRKTGRTYRLPSESEWEYAARAGTAVNYPWGTAFEREKANCLGCNAQQLSRTTNVGTFPANPFGLFDMAGNVAQWVEDCWHPNYKGAPSDGSAWVTPQCAERVLRGGSFNNDPRYLRTAARFKYDYDVRFYTNGFRIVRDQ
jgi:formylglycine-generating enzyme required for sulfatase activity